MRPKYFVFLIVVRATSLHFCCFECFENMDCEILITLVHERRSLWDQKSKQYHNRELNKKLWKEVAAAMKLEDDAVRQKWRGLRDTFRKEISKLDQKRSGDGADDEPQSKWQYFKNMLFIKDQFVPRKATGNIKNTAQYSTCNETEEDTTLSPMSNNDQSELQIDTEMSQQSESSINPASTNDKKRSATDQEKSNKANPPRKKTKTVNDNAIQELMHIEKEKLQQFKQHLENKQDDDTYFLLSLIPYIQSLPVYRKLFLRSKFIQLVMQEHEAISSHATHEQSTSRQCIPIPTPSPAYSTSSTDFSQAPTPTQQTNECNFNTSHLVNNYTDGPTAVYLTNFQPNDFA